MPTRAVDLGRRAETAFLLDRSERHVLAFHALYAAVAAGVFAALVATLGTRIWGPLVLGYNLALPIAARLLGHREWLALWLFLVPLSVLQVVSDWVLSAVFEVLVFPDVGGPRIGPVNASMAGMWTIGCASACPPSADKRYHFKASGTATSGWRDPGAGVGQPGAAA